MIIRTGTARTCLLLLILSPLLLTSAQADNDEELPSECEIDCVSPYGNVLGVSRRGVEAYSNCQSDCVIYEPNQWKGEYTGIKWQCVEYARRWLLMNKGMTYGDVDFAADIWNEINHLTDISTNRPHPLETHLNGSNQPPRVGDLLVYASEFNDTGHVAVVIDADYEDGVIAVAEQNYNNETWPDDYSRKIELVRREDNYWLLDEYLLGWKHLKDRK